MNAPRVIRPEDRTAPPGSQSLGLHREAAIADEGLWIGVVRADPGVGGWHHHGENDTYVYLLEGAIRIEGRDSGAMVEGKAGDFVHVPRRIVHREITPEGGQVGAIVIRIGTGPELVNVED